MLEQNMLRIEPVSFSLARDMAATSGGKNIMTIATMPGTIKSWLLKDELYQALTFKSMAGPPLPNSGYFFRKKYG